MGMHWIRGSSKVYNVMVSAAGNASIFEYHGTSYKRGIILGAGIQKRLTTNWSCVLEGTFSRFSPFRIEHIFDDPAMSTDHFQSRTKTRIFALTFKTIYSF